jgi:hypothetical protein
VAIGDDSIITVGGPEPPGRRVVRAAVPGYRISAIPTPRRLGGSTLAQKTDSTLGTLTD